MSIDPRTIGMHGDGVIPQAPSGRLRDAAVDPKPGDRVSPAVVAAAEHREKIKRRRELEGEVAGD